MDNKLIARFIISENGITFDMPGSGPITIKHGYIYYRVSYLYSKNEEDGILVKLDNRLHNEKHIHISDFNKLIEDDDVDICELNSDTEKYLDRIDTWDEYHPYEIGTVILNILNYFFKPWTNMFDITPRRYTIVSEQFGLNVIAFDYYDSDVVGVKIN